MKKFIVRFNYGQIDDAEYTVSAKNKKDAQRKFTRLATSIEQVN